MNHASQPGPARPQPAATPVTASLPTPSATPEPVPCPVCRTPVATGAPAGFCPVCVLRAAAGDAPLPFEDILSASTATLDAAGTGAPAVETVQAALPDLEVECLIGLGGMGFVYRARQLPLDRTVAVKILAPGLSRDPAFAERFAREARALGRLSHPNIVAIHAHGKSGGFYWLIMEYVDGVNLRQAMRAGRFTPQQALSVVPGICDALQAAHAQGIWHRDIKPENILLDTRGQVKIADFGIARLAGDPRRDFTLTLTGAALGSAAYMAPEQHEKPHDVDHRADIYSLGVVIYEMLTGELPLGRFPAPSLRAAVDARIDEIVLRTLEKERGLRQQSATEVKTDLTSAATPSPAPSSAPRQETAPSSGPEIISTAGSRPGKHGLSSTAPRPGPAPSVLTATFLMLGGLLTIPAAAILTSGSPRNLLLAVAVLAFTAGWLTGILALFRMRTGAIPVIWCRGLRLQVWGIPGSGLAFVLTSVLLYFGRLQTSGGRPSPIIHGDTGPLTDSAPGRQAVLPPSFSAETDSGKAPATDSRPSDSSGAPADPADVPSPPASLAVTASPDVLETFRTLNRLANANDADGFQILAPRRQVLITGDTPAAEKMQSFSGEILRLHLVGQKNQRPGPFGIGVIVGSAEVLALLKDRDGTSTWRQFRFQNKNGWKFQHTSSPGWTSSAVIQFQPPGGDGQKILETHLPDSVEITPEAHGTGLFRIGLTVRGESPSAPGSARARLNFFLEQLGESLKKSGLPVFGIHTAPTLPSEPAYQPDLSSARSSTSPSWPVTVPPLPEPDSGNRFTVWGSHLRNAGTLEQRGDLEGALHSARKAVGSARSLTEESKRGFGALALCLIRAGDLYCRQGLVEEALESYQESLGPLIRSISENPHMEAGNKKLLTQTRLKLGDVLTALQRPAEALRQYRTAAGFEDGKWSHAWSDAPAPYENLEVPFDGKRLEELLEIYSRASGRPDNPDAVRELSFLICRAGAAQDRRFSHLLRDELLKKNLPLPLAAYDYSTNQDPEALAFILNRLAAQPVGSDCSETGVLAFVDEWTLSWPAVESHFTTTDGAGGLNQASFLRTRSFLFPRNWLLHLHPDLERAPLNTR